MVVYLLARDSHGDICVVAVSAHYNLAVTNTGVGPYGFYPGSDVLKQVEASGIPLPFQGDLEKTTRSSDHRHAEKKLKKITGR